MFYNKLAIIFQTSPRMVKEVLNYSLRYVGKYFPITTMNSHTHLIEMKALYISVCFSTEIGYYIVIPIKPPV